MVGQPPWNLFKAQAYLETLCKRNEEGQEPESLDFRTIFEYRVKDFLETNLESVGDTSVPREIRFTAAPGGGRGRGRGRGHAGGARGGGMGRGGRIALKRPAAHHQGAAKKRPAGGASFACPAQTSCENKAYSMLSCLVLAGASFESTCKTLATGFG